MAGIGASAGGLDALTQLLRDLPADTGVAFVLVQHLQANHPSGLVGILGRATSMPVREARDGMQLQANAVFVIPPNAELTIGGGRLRIAPRPHNHGPHAPIDVLFRSLAADCGAHGIGVVLSGAGADGADGLLAIKAAGGRTFAQEPSSAEFASMPAMAVAAGGVDLVLPPERIGPEIARLVREPPDTETPGPDGPAPALETPALNAIFGVMHESCGVDFSLYRDKTVRRRLHRRMGIRQVQSLAAYAQLVADEPGERVALQRDLLIGVTHFFRDPDAFESLKLHVFPALTRDRRPDAPIRIWVPGCATGEEAYSILIALHEYMDGRGLSLPVQLFASDISEVAIDAARSGRYPSTIAVDVSPDRLRQFFTRVETGYQIGRQLREQCIFSRHNLLDDPPFSRLDLISCRNLLIYLDSVQRTIIPLFHYALQDPGFLMLGRSETAHYVDLFTAVDPRLRIYAKRPTSRRPYRSFARLVAARRASDGLVPAPPAAAALAPLADLHRQADQILISRFAPSSVLLDDDLQVLEFRGRPVPFFTLPAGKASLHLLRLMVDTSLFLQIETLVREAGQSGAPASRRDVPYRGADGNTGIVDIEVAPLGPERQRAFLVILEAHAPGPSVPATPPAADDTGESARLVARLTDELAQTRHRLVTQMEAHETSEEASQQVAEDALSSNEELQSLAEELETAKEELQSTNEELITVNRDLEARNSELLSARDFGRSIVETVHAPLVVVDGDQTVRHVNASFSRVFRVEREAVEGQPLAAACERAWDVPLLHNLIAAVLRDNQPFDDVEITRPFTGGRLRTLLLSGRRLAQNDMVLLTIDDVTEQRAMEHALHESEERRQQAEKLESVGRLAGGIAHDFNNLLTVIIGYCSLLDRSLEGDAERHEQVQQILASAERAAVLTDQLLAFSRRKMLRPRVFDLNGLLGEFERMLRRVLEQRILVAVQGAPDLWPVRADPVEIGRVVMNLALNARDAMPAGGTLTLATENVVLDQERAAEIGLAPGRYVRLLVSDTGVGMDSNTRAHLFEPFYSTKDASKGAGLGLPTVLGIVQQSGGAVSFDSVPGAGTSFSVLLPVAPAGDGEPEPGATGRVAAPDGAAEVILLVEDEENVRRLARTVLTMSGYTVLEARGSAEAMQIVREYQGPIALLLSDVVLPDGRGRQLSEEARVVRPDLKVLFVSGHTEDVLLQEGVLSGVPFLQKPFTPAALSRRVRTVLGPAR